MAEAQAKRLGAILYPGFELLDMFGPLEMFGNLTGIVEVAMVAQTKGPVASAQGPAAVAEYGFTDCPHLDLILVPGGIGTRDEVENPVMLQWLAQRVPQAEVAMTVCTGSALGGGREVRHLLGRVRRHRHGAGGHRASERRRRQQGAGARHGVRMAPGCELGSVRPAGGVGVIIGYRGCRYSARGCSPAVIESLRAGRLGRRDSDS